VVFIRFLTSVVLLDVSLTVSTALFIQSDLKAADSMSAEAEHMQVIATGLLCVYGLVMLVSLLSLYFYHLNLIGEKNVFSGLEQLSLLFKLTLFCVSLSALPTSDQPDDE
jgi:hypothetical protein